MVHSKLNQFVIRHKRKKVFLEQIFKVRQVLGWN